MRSIPRLSLLFVAMFVAGCAGVGTRAAAPVAGPAREVLPNGVVLIVQEHRAGDVVALQLWMRTGGRDESAEELGLSHYLEHMLFKGTPTRPPGSIDQLIEGIGGTSNAFTSYDYTHYDVVVPADQLRVAVELLADIAVNAAFAREELESEKKVVFEEMKLTEDDPDRFLSRRLSEEAYRPHPYGRPILGTPALVQALTRERLDAYYKKHYVPRNMALVVVGAVEPGQARAVAAAAFGALTGPAPARAARVPPPRADARRRVDIRRAEQQAYLGLAWPTPPVSHEDVFAVDLLSYILGDGPSSRLNQSVREQKGLVSAIEASYVPRAQAGLVSVTAHMDADKLQAAEAAIIDVLRRVRAEGVTEAERARALVTAEAFYAFDIETAEGLARTYGQAETTWTLDDELRYLARLRGVTIAQIQAAARRYLGDDNYVRVRFVPGGGR
ncbi:MAG: pitrilysin family protein [Candidatus Rokuibacteriota bacterium]